MGMIIRHALPEDVEALSAIESECFPPTEAATLETLRDRVNIYGNHFYIMFENDRPVSFVDGFVTDEPDLTDEMFEKTNMHCESGEWQMIFGVNTIPAFRRQGRAGQLIRCMIADAKREHRKGMVLTAKTEKVAYYEKFGFKDEGITNKSCHGGVPWHQMRLTFEE